MCLVDGGWLGEFVGSQAAGSSLSDDSDGESEGCRNPAEAFPSLTGSPVEIKDINEVEAEAWAL